jgi:hypothetical protein
MYGSYMREITKILPSLRGYADNITNAMIDVYINVKSQLRLNHFHYKLEEVSMHFTKSTLKLHSYTETLVSDDGEVHRSLSTELLCDPLDFEYYSIQSDSCVTINLKEFKTVLSFGEVMSLPIQISFSTAGKYILSYSV